MGSSKGRFLLIVGLLGMFILVVPAVAQNTPGADAPMHRAQQVATQLLLGPLPRSEFSPTSVTIYLARYQPGEKKKYVLPMFDLQWWVSPNLAIAGGLGSGLAGQQIIQPLRIGLRYLPASLTLGPLTPEITFVQNRIEGLPEYGLKWNEVSWVYSAKIGFMNVAGALVLLFQSVFPRSTAKGPDVPEKLEATTRILALSAGYDLFRWLRLSAQVKANPNFVTMGAQLSLAI